MSKYKLIKEYPGSHPVGSISKMDYSKFPEFWEKIEEVDYEILSFIRIDSTCVPKDNIGILFELQEDGLFATYNKYSFHSEKSMLEGKHSVKTGFFAIHSVKRLSDGEVFTIGDVIEYLSFGKDKLIIDKFKIENNTILILGNNYGKYISGAKKIKTPLFTTEDQIDIFIGDKFYVVDTTFEKYRLQETVGGQFSKEKPNFKRFHSKQKAEDFVIENKPCLSIKEITTYVQINWYDKQCLKSIVKQKL